MSHRLLILLLTATLAACQQATVKPEPPPAPEPVKSPPTLSAPSEAGASPPPTNSSDPAPTPAPLPDYPRYDTAKADFQYGPGQPWPTLEVPTDLRPGPLAVEGAPHLHQGDGSAVGSRAATDHSTVEDGPCASELAASSLDIGPKEAWLTSKIKSAAAGLLSKALFGFGGGSSDPEPAGPPTVKNPLRKVERQSFHDQLSDIELELAGRLDDDGLLLNTHIEDAPDKSTFHAIYLENRQCQRQFPDRYLNYRVWLEWSLSVSWTKTTRHYQNDQLVSEKSRSGGFFKSGKLNLAQGSINLSDPSALDAYQQGLLDDLPAPIWQQLGFSGPTAGTRALGSQFNQVDAESLLRGDSIAVVHLTRVVDGRYVTRALPFKLMRGQGNLLRFTRL